MDDIKRLRKLYGENFAKMCRDFFPTILEKEGELFSIITNHFYPSHFLYDDIVSGCLEDKFKTYIYNLFDAKQTETVKKNETAEELFDKAGYILYPECETEQDIQSYITWYAPGEELCTFRGGRLSRARVWFAIKKNVDQIKRENFQIPERQDEYGTSVLSIQFSIGTTSTLSIKNRYNHHVQNSDATFSNDLDNIFPGLTEAFCKDYNINLSSSTLNLNLPNYVYARNGKFYRRNINSYCNDYCCGNVAIHDGNPEFFNPCEQLLIDTFLINFKEKTITNLENDHTNLIAPIETIKKITIDNLENEERRILFFADGFEPVKVVINKYNQLVEYENNNIEEIEDYFLLWTENLRSLIMKNLKVVGNNCCSYLNNLTVLELPKLETIGHRSFNAIDKLTNLSLPELKSTGNHCFTHDQSLVSFYAPKLEKVGQNFLRDSHNLVDINLDSLTSMGNSSLENIKSMTNLSLKSLKSAGNECLHFCGLLEEVNLPALEEAGICFLTQAYSLVNLYAPNLKVVGNSSLYFLNVLKKLNLENLESVDENCFSELNSCKIINLPKLKEIPKYNFVIIGQIEEINLNSAEQITNCFQNHLPRLKRLNLDSVKSIGNNCFANCKNLEYLYAPNLKTKGKNCFKQSENVTIAQNPIKSELINEKPKTNNIIFFE